MAYVIDLSSWASRKKKKNNFLRLLRENMGNIKLTCLEIGIDRTTFYEWKENDPWFRGQVFKIDTEQIDEVEDIFIKHVAKEEPWAIKMYMNARNPKYTKKVDNFIIPTEKTIEDILKDYKPENHGRQRPTNEGPAQNTEQEGRTGLIQTERGTEILLGEEDEEEFNTESPAKRA